MLRASTLQELIEFRRERDWQQFHTIRNLCTALAIEAAELQEIFLWSTDDEVASRVAGRRGEITNEVADLAILLSYICNDMGIDIDQAVLEKVAINRGKYPIENFRGSSRKYNQK